MKIPRIIILMLLIFILWASLFKIDGGASSSGTISSVNSHQNISHFEGGIVKKVFVKEGDKVDKGEALIVIENLSFFEKKQKNKQIISALSPKIDRLKSELNLETYTPKTKNSYSKHELELFLRRQTKLTSEIEVLNNKIEQTTEKQGFLLKTQLFLIEELSVLKEEYIRTEKLIKLGASSQEELNIVQKNKLKTHNNLNEINSNIVSNKKEIKGLKSEIQLKKDIFLNETQSKLDEALQKIAKAKNAYYVVQKRESRSILRAVNAGIVYKLWTPVIGTVIQAGKPVIEIASTDGESQVVSKVSVIDRDKIWVGMDAKITISHWQLPLAPIKAVVTDISADSFTNDKTQESYYKVTIKIKKVDNNIHKKILVGMVVDVLFVIGRQRIIEYLLSPINKGIQKVMNEPV